MKPFEKEKNALPAFPRTKHLPYKPNATSNDLIATEAEAATVFSSLVNIEEKIDGASVGICLHPKHNLIIRNRDHVLRKNYYKKTAAKEQFRSIWGWFYGNKTKFEHINEHGPYSVYGEWCLAQHGIYYDNLPDWFIAYDIYDYEVKKFLAPPVARKLLENAGFSLPPILSPSALNYEHLESLTNLTSAWTKYNSHLVEGVYLKTYNDQYVIDRFKMVGQSYVRGALWNSDRITKNSTERR